MPFNRKSVLFWLGNRVQLTVTPSPSLFENKEEKRGYIARVSCTSLPICSMSEFVDNYEELYTGFWNVAFQTISWAILNTFGVDFPIALWKSICVDRVTVPFSLLII